MKPEMTNEKETGKRDEDVSFEVKVETAIKPLTSEETKAVGETTIPAKEDTLGNSDFPPLSESDKQPKLPKEE